MLNPDIISAMIPLATQQAQVGRKLVPATDSALDYLTKVSGLGGLATSDGAPLDIHSAAAILGERASMDDHNETLDVVISGASDAVIRVLGMARRVVIPDIKDIYQKTKAQIDARLALISEPYQIQPIAPAAFLNNVSVRDQVGRYANAAFEKVPTLNFPRMTVEEIKEKISTSNDELNKQLLSLPPATFNDAAQVWCGYENFSILNQDSMYILFLLSKAMYETPPEGVTSTLVNYQAVLATLIEQCGLGVHSAIERNERDLRVQALYASGNHIYPASGPQPIYVNNDVYRQLLEEKKITPEALIGNEMLQRRYPSIDLLTPEVRYRCEEVYRTNLAALHRQHTMNEITSTRNALGRVMAQEINERKDLVVQPEILATLLREKIDCLSEDDLRCLEHAVRDVVCDVFYAHTDVKRYLQILDRQEDPTPDADPRHKALVATMEYVCVWLASQIKPVVEQDV